MTTKVEIKVVGYERSSSHTASQEQVQRYGPELLRIESERGTLDNKTILSEAKPESSPLHDWFTWDDGEAAERWRENEAHLLRGAINVRIRYQDGREFVGPIAIALQVRTEKGKGNREPLRVISLVRTLQTKEDTAQMIADALAAYVALRNRWKMLDSLAGQPLSSIHHEIDEMQQRIASGRVRHDETEEAEELEEHKEHEEAKEPSLAAGASARDS